MRTLDATPALLMPYQKPKRSDRLAEIVNEVVGELSLEQAAIHANHVVSHQTIARLKRGMLGLESTVRQFAEAFSVRMCERYGTEIAAKYGQCTPRDCADWLVGEAGFRPPPTIGSGTEPESSGDAIALAQKVDDLSRKLDAILGKLESPRERYERTIRERAHVYRQAGYQVPETARLGQGGGNFRSDEDADRAVEVWEEEVAELNPGKKRLFPVPDFMIEE